MLKERGEKIKENFPLIVITILVPLFLISGCNLMEFPPEEVEQEDLGAIVGKVTPAQQNIKVQLIQNLSLVVETFTDEQGNYRFDNIPQGYYGLLFISQNAGVYLYNNSMANWTLVTDMKETITPNSFDVNLDLSKQRPEYAKGRITVKFKSDVTEYEIEKLITDYNCTIDRQDKHPYGTYYYINIPEDKTVLELVRDFNLKEIIEHAEPEGLAFAESLSY